jgi:hypothetical protein
VNSKPTTEDLGIDPDAVDWQRSGPGNDDAGDGSIEIAFVRGSGTAGDGGSRVPPVPADWVLMRVAGDPDRRVLVFDRHEWECFLDGARKGEFDDAAGSAGPTGR